MSPTTFRFQVAQIQSELTFCIEFCQDIRTNRNLAGTKNLDGLQNALESAEASIPDNFNTFRTHVGAKLDAGDDRSWREMNQHIVDLQNKIKPHLKEMSKPSKTHTKHERQKAGFKDMLHEWEGIHREVNTTMKSLARRVETESRPTPAAPTPQIVTPAREPRPRRPEETTQASDYLVDHIKNSWEETIVNGAFMYINSFDRRRQQREKPEGAYIKSMPRSSRPRTPSWDMPSSSSTRSWETRY